ncbi:hypothetical protein LDO32_00725 [Luteimonas sp. Y-2-2-4F]|nr:aldolase/citrate lyase family protein [Luteimonas sp. Y-2-2-4F]MCD9030260.1 hypothetical protein [Luteimonas sp. Y-2-2-4F]
MKHRSPIENRPEAPRVGTFVKTGSAAQVEILGLAGLDFAILDAEHAPLDLPALDRMLLAGRATGLPCLVRLRGRDPAMAGAVLDLGAAGIVVPHTCSAEDARQAVSIARYAGGERGFSPSTRAGGYGAARPDTYPPLADAAVAVWCQVEDARALAALDAIAATPGIDCLLVGPADLAVSLGTAPGTPAWTEAIEAIVAAGRRHGVAVGIAVGDIDDGRRWLDAGVDRLVCGSDQAFVAAGARRVRTAFSPAPSGVS